MASFRLDSVDKPDSSKPASAPRSVVRERIRQDCTPANGGLFRYLHQKEKLAILTERLHV
jgi:hypothetical protein